MTRDVRGGIGANNIAGELAVVPQVMLIFDGREYGPVRLDGLGDPPLTVGALASISDDQLKTVVAEHFDLPDADLRKHVVVRPNTGNVVISAPTVLG